MCYCAVRPPGGTAEGPCVAAMSWSVRPLREPAGLGWVMPESGGAAAAPCDTG